MIRLVNEGGGVRIAVSTPVWHGVKTGTQSSGYVWTHNLGGFPDDWIAEQSTTGADNSWWTTEDIWYNGSHHIGIRSISYVNDNQCSSTVYRLGGSGYWLRVRFFKYD